MTGGSRPSFRDRSSCRDLLEISLDGTPGAPICRLTAAGRLKADLVVTLSPRDLRSGVHQPAPARHRDLPERTGLGERAEVRPDLGEWDYGDYEGITTAEIHESVPDWSLWTDGAPASRAPSGSRPASTGSSRSCGRSTARWHCLTRAPLSSAGGSLGQPAHCGGPVARRPPGRSACSRSTAGRRSLSAGTTTTTFVAELMGAPAAARSSPPRHRVDCDENRGEGKRTGRNRVPHTRPCISDAPVPRFPPDPVEVDVSADAARSTPGPGWQRWRTSPHPGGGRRRRRERTALPGGRRGRAGEVRSSRYGDGAGPACLRALHAPSPP